MSRALSILLTCLLLAPVVRGYAVDDDPLQYQGLESLAPLDARVEDVSILSASLRVESAGLAMPSGFDAVYRVPGNSGKLMRVNGALFAVFDQSVYQSYQGRSYPEVPPSTVFHIGPPLEGFSTSATESSSSVTADTVTLPHRAGFGYVAPATTNTRETHVGFSEPWPEAEPLPKFISDPKYRAARLAELVERRLNRS